MNRREALGLLAGAPVAVAVGAVAAHAAPAGGPPVGGLLPGEGILTRDAARALGPDGIAALNRGSGPQEHPLATALGAGWLWLRRPDHATTVLVHDSGLWTELDDTALWMATPEVVEQAAKTLRDGLARGLTGPVSWWSTALGPGLPAQAYQVTA